MHRYPFNTHANNITRPGWCQLHHEDRLLNRRNGQNTSPPHPWHQGAGGIPGECDGGETGCTVVMCFVSGFLINCDNYDSIIRNSPSSLCLLPSSSPGGAQWPVDQGSDKQSSHCGHITILALWCHAFSSHTVHLTATQVGGPAKYYFENNKKYGRKEVDRTLAKNKKLNGRPLTKLLFYWQP